MRLRWLQPVLILALCLPPIGCSGEPRKGTVEPDFTGINPEPVVPEPIADPPDNQRPDEVLATEPATPTK
jgi:hypothetical protein